VGLSKDSKQLCLGQEMGRAPSLPDGKLEVMIPRSGEGISGVRGSRIFTGLFIHPQRFNGFLSDFDGFAPVTPLERRIRAKGGWGVRRQLF